MPALPQGDPALTGSSCVPGLEEADLDSLRVPGIDGEVHPVVRHGRPERGREIVGGVHGHKPRESLTLGT
jgi:hypothetical protein